MTKITDFELTALEEMRVRFQENVSSLIEIEAELDRKFQYANSNGKEGIFINGEEVKIITRHLRTIIAELLGSYDVMNHSTKLLIFQKRLLEKSEMGFADKGQLNDKAA